MYTAPLLAHSQDLCVALKKYLRVHVKVVLASDVAYSQNLQVDLKNYLKVHVKVVPAGNLILFIYEMDSFCPPQV